MGTESKRKLQSAFHQLANIDTISVDDLAVYIEFNAKESREVSLEVMGFAKNSEPTSKEILERFDALRSTLDINSFEFEEIITALGYLIKPLGMELISPKIKWSEYHNKLAKRCLNLPIKEKLTIEKLENIDTSFVKSVPFCTTYRKAHYAFITLWTELDIANGRQEEELKHARASKRLRELEEPLLKYVNLTLQKKFQRIVLFDVKNNKILEQSEDVASNANQEAKESAMQQFAKYGLKSPFTVKDLDTAFIKASFDNWVLPKEMKDNYKMLALLVA